MNIRRWLWLSVVGNGILFIGLVGLIFLLTQLRVDVAEQRQLVEKREAQKSEVEKQLVLTQTQLEAALKTVQELTAQKQAEYMAASIPAADQVSQNNLSWLPVTIAFRKSLFGGSEVLILGNPTSQTIQLELEVYSPTFRNGKTFQRTIPAKDKIELGHMEGWAFAHGDKLHFESAGFQPYDYTVN